MNTKHTPGPWSVDDKAMKVRDAKGLTVAEPFTLDDARLIAAAPDLLSALRAMVGDGEHNEKESLAMARAALAKAGGAAVRQAAADADAQ